MLGHIEISIRRSNRQTYCQDFQTIIAVFCKIVCTNIGIKNAYVYDYMFKNVEWKNPSWVCVKGTPDRQKALRTECLFVAKRKPPDSTVAQNILTD